MILKIQTQDILEIASSILDSDIVIPFRLIVGITPEDYSEFCTAVDTIMRIISRWKVQGYVHDIDLHDFMFSELVIFGKTPKSDLILKHVATKHSKKFEQDVRMQVAAMIA